MKLEKLHRTKRFKEGKAKFVTKKHRKIKKGKEIAEHKMKKNAIAKGRELRKKFRAIARKRGYNYGRIDSEHTGKGVR
jgi:hypothetical protein